MSATEVLSSSINAPPTSKFTEIVTALSKRPGTIATILLDTSSGSLIHATGSLPSTSSTKTESFTDKTSPISPTQESWSKSTTSVRGVEGETASLSPGSGELQKMASVALTMVRAAGALVETLDPEDLTKLLRLRTKKYELVIVPDPKYIFVVVHETPSA